MSVNYSGVQQKNIELHTFSCNLGIWVKPPPLLLPPPPPLWLDAVSDISSNFTNVDICDAASV
ncbi:hypothetical protein Hanom_Chr14g01283081 [Helianthus anomalus]